ncbi:hypothetical protein EV426DRAFT_636640 [Tirmania nivea]|nr:hypothetical protein EV426DRAFT_636640 [Tirmania nivea]
MKCALLDASQGYGLETLGNLISAGHICYVLCRNLTAFDATLRSRNIDPSILHSGEAKLINLALFAAACECVGFVLVNMDIHMQVSDLTFKNPIALKLIPPAICSWNTAIFLPIFTSSYPLMALVHKGIQTSPALSSLYTDGFSKELHADKEEMERLINTRAGIQHVNFNQTGENQGILGNVVIVRPALLTDGVAKGSEALRKGDRVTGAWMVSRNDADSHWRGVG